MYLNAAPDTTIGGTLAGAGNLISGNINAGVFIDGTGAQPLHEVVAGNVIGTDVTGTQSLYNGRGHPELGYGYGVQIGNCSGNLVGGTLAGAANLIAGNSNAGVLISRLGADAEAADNLIQGNWIGTDVTGTTRLPNYVGIEIDYARFNTIGGTTAAARNLVSGNFSAGVFLNGISGTDPASDNLIEGNYIGTDPAGTRAVGNGQGIDLAGADHNWIGGTAAGAGNLISGNSFGLFLANLAQANQVLGNLIGTDVTGMAAVPNLQDGVYIGGGIGTVVGGTDSAARNIISGNQGNGVFISSYGNLLEGNFIGTDRTGAQTLGSRGRGVFVSSGLNDNTIGGTAAGAGNLISGNAGDGLLVGSFMSQGTPNQVAGNFIGTDLTGTVAIPNGGNGVEVGLSTGEAVIGGMTAGAGNLIAGNVAAGILIDAGASGALVQGNVIGTDVSGTLALGNQDGVDCLGADTTIGGTTAGAGNLVSGNNGVGILLEGDANLVQGNWIGTDVTGTVPLGNGADGVEVVQASANVIGGTAAGAGNRIAFNGHDGVLVDTGTGNAIRRDVIVGHDVGLGIELANDGNNGQNAPVLTAASSDSFTTTIAGTLVSTPDTIFTVELFVNTVCNPSGSGEGEQFLASFTVTTDGDGNASFSLTVAIAVAPGQFISATATDPNGNTSAFAACVTVTGPGARGKATALAQAVALDRAGTGLARPWGQEILGVTEPVTPSPADRAVLTQSSAMTSDLPPLAGHPMWPGADLFFRSFGQEPCVPDADLLFLGISRDLSDAASATGKASGWEDLPS